MSAASWVRYRTVARPRAGAVALAAVLAAWTVQAAEPVVSTFAGNGRTGYEGDGGDRRAASLVFPVALAWEDAGHLLYLDMGRDFGGRVRRIDLASGVIETIAGGGNRGTDRVPAREATLSNSPVGLARDSKGNLYIGYADAGRVDRIDATTGLIERYAGGGDSLEDDIEPRQLALANAWNVRVDAADNLYIVDKGLHAVFRVDARSGRVRRIAGTPGKAGHAGDGGPATEALLNWPSDVAWDAAGNLYLADRDNHVIRLIEAGTGSIRAYAGTAGAPGFEGDGGDRSRARFRYPQFLLLEGGALLVSDRMNHRVRRIDLERGTVTTVAGNGKSAYAGENVPALQAGIYEPLSLLSKGPGEVLVAASRSRRILLVGGPVTLPVPWWRSGWAIATCLASLGLLTFGVVQLRTRALRARTVALEASVAQRSRELAGQTVLMEQQAAQLSTLIEAKDRLMARVSHEFRTPLAVILGPTRRWLRQAPDGALREHVGVIERNAARLLRLVEQLLDFARLSHGHLGPSEPVPAAAIIRRAAASFESRATDKGVTLRAGPIEDLVVQARASVLETVVGHLLSNAIRFTGAGGQVQLMLVANDGHAELVVADDGCGIAADRIPRLFEPLRDDSAADGQARGIGLALVAQLVSAHGGAIEVASEVGRGSRFTVRLPLAAAVPAPAAPAPAAAEDPEPEPATGVVLVVEDNDDMREYLRQRVASRHRCLAARDGEQGLAVALDEIPDLVVCDVLLPGRDGFEVCRQIKADDRTSHVPVLLLTALDDAAHRLRGLDAGADDYLAKPFDDAELLARIANLLEIRALLRQRYARDLLRGAEPASDLATRDRALLERLARAADARHADADFDPPALAASLAISERHLQRKLKALVGQSPAEYLRGVRLRHARERLERGERPSDVALAVGFGSHAYFATCFRAEFGCTPSEFGACQSSRESPIDAVSP